MKSGSYEMNVKNETNVKCVLKSNERYEMYVQYY